MQYQLGIFKPETPVNFVLFFLGKYLPTQVSGCDEEIVNSSLRWGDHLGLLTMLTTFSPLSGDVMIRLTEDFKDIARVNVVRLHEISTESDMSKR